jgi:Uma2 family endonuclease
MTAIVTPPIHYPAGDGQPGAETFDHLYVILITIEVLRQYLEEVQAVVMGNQYLYYSQGYPRLRCAPDVMVIFGVEPRSRDNYKIWEEGAVPRVIFEMTSASTKDQDEGFKKDLYEQLGVEEYWQFDPKQDWIDGQLRGYRLVGDGYVPMVSDRPEVIGNHQSTALGLRLEPAGALIAFYRLDNGEKLLIPVELRARAQNLQASLQLAEAELMAERSRTEALQLLVDRYRNQFGDL